MAQKYVIAIFGNVATSVGLLTEGQITKISDTAYASAEITDFVTKGYLALFATLAAAQSYAFTPTAVRYAKGDRSVLKPMQNTPVLTAAEEAAEADLLAKAATLAAAQAAKVIPDAITANLAALHTANPSVAEITAAAAAAKVTSDAADAAVVSATTAYNSAVTALATAKSNLVP